MFSKKIIIFFSAKSFNLKKLIMKINTLW